MSNIAEQLHTALAGRYTIERELGAERFLSEIRTTARLQHPHRLSLFDSGDADGLLYYVMPVVTGENQQRLPTGKRRGRQRAMCP